MDAFDRWQQQPNRETLLRLLVESQHSVYNACFQVLRHPQDAEDAAQEVLLEILDGINAIPDLPSFKRWLYRVSFHTAVDFRRKRTRRAAHEQRAALMNDPVPADNVRD